MNSMVGTMWNLTNYHYLAVQKIIRLPEWSSKTLKTFLKHDIAASLQTICKSDPL